MATERFQYLADSVIHCLHHPEVGPTHILRVPGNERQVTLGPDDAKELDLLIGVNALPKVE